MYAFSCKTYKTATIGELTLKSSTGTVLELIYVYDYFPDFIKLTGASALAAGSYTIEVQAYWEKSDVKDFTVTLYAPSKISLLDSKRKQKESGKHDYTYMNVDARSG